ncbi:hypothetical protein BDR07DRAFT_1424531, partial [Suillus spraguei]
RDFHGDGDVVLALTRLRGIGDAKTHQLYQKLTEITEDAAMKDIFRALSAQSESSRYTFSRGIVHTSILSGCFFAFLAILGKLLVGRNGLYLNTSSYRAFRRQSFLRPSPFISRWLLLVLKQLPNIFVLNQLLLCIALVVTHYLAL